MMDPQTDQPDVWKLNLGCGTKTLPRFHNVDIIDHTGVDQVVDLEDRPWPWDDDSIEEIQAQHVFEHLENMEATLRECERILVPGGQLVVRMPVGLDSWADPDHVHRWDYRTPDFYCGARPWDVDVGLEVVEKDVNLWPAGQENALAMLDVLKWKYREWQDGQGSWMFNQPGSSGEFRVVFEKP